MLDLHSLKIDIYDLFASVRVHSEGGQPALHKPLLLLFALGRCYNKHERMIPFSLVDESLRQLFSKFYPIGLESSNTHYPFGKLENDRLWEVEKSQELRRTSVGHLLKKELLEKNSCGGFNQEIYQALSSNRSLIMTISNQILNTYFPPEQHTDISVTVNLPQPIKSSEKVDDSSGFYQKDKWDLNNMDEEESKRMKINDFIAYLNSLHNLEASGANALAESQALNRYFTELYEPFPLIEDVFKVLVNDEEKVVVITGHAGDGKSTVALDILKRLRRLPPNQPLNQPLEELEEVQWPKNHSGYQKICVVKDMSELTAKRRLQWIQQGFDQPGTWLIISNTGPLLNTLKEWSQQAGDIESEILKGLDQPYTSGDLSLHTLKQFSKPLVIVNMTRLDNVILGSRLLTRMVSHSAWQQCTGCSAEVACPLLLNRQALQTAASIVEERVRWIYQRLTAYEQRLTMRQMIAHLALSLTGGMTCHQAKEHVALSATVEGSQALAGLEDIVFSEGFFGYRKGKPWPAAENLRAIALVRRLVFGGPIAVDFERQLLGGDGTTGWAQLPATLSPLNEHWRSRIGEAASVRWRFAQRRMIYMFGKKIDGADAREELFLNSFLQSPRLRDFDQWQRYGAFGTFDATQQHRFCKACLRVLLEVFSGFSAGQFQSDQDRLYLTLRRPDRAVAQPTQLVIAMLPFEDFDLYYDSVRRLPLLRFQLGKIDLALSLPLLDYIQRRHTGELGSDLARIHLAQLERFRAELLQATKNNYQKPGEIRLLRADIDGRVHLHRYFLDEKNQRLEYG